MIDFQNSANFVSLIIRKVFKQEFLTHFYQNQQNKVLFQKKNKKKYIKPEPIDLQKPFIQNE